jgi:hypothetical protein
VVDLTVVVFSGRSEQLPELERAYTQVAFNSASNTVNLAYSGDKPPIRKGSWILDATIVQPSGGNGSNSIPEPHGFFYRIVGVTDKGSYLTVELQTNPKMSSVTRTGTPYGVLIVLENVVEVFEKGPGWMP